MTNALKEHIESRKKLLESLEKMNEEWKELFDTADGDHPLAPILNKLEKDIIKFRADLKEMEDRFQKKGFLDDDE